MRNVTKRYKDSGVSDSPERNNYVNNLLPVENAREIFVLS
jgi:hypothetical protein